MGCGLIEILSRSKILPNYFQQMETEATVRLPIYSFFEAHNCGFDDIKSGSKVWLSYS